jgi:hypothetical protein
MSGRGTESVLVVASGRERPATSRVWGTGGWVPPAEREALDWFTLTRIMGWTATLTWPDAPDFEVALSTRSDRWIILACDADGLRQDAVAALSRRLVDEPIGVIGRAAAAGSAWAQLAGTSRRDGSTAGRDLRWIEPSSKRSWRCRDPIESTALDEPEMSGRSARGVRATETWATLDGAPCIIARRVGRGVVVTLAFHPSQARDTSGVATAAVRHLLVCGTRQPAAWLDFEACMALRMDDPGGAQNVHSQQWCYPKLGERQWAEVGADLRRRAARLSVGYVPAWVDDGDAVRGTLELRGGPAPRVAGAVHPSPHVTYHDRAGHQPGMVHDYQSEFRGIQALRAQGLCDVELHGYTHMHPDTARWASAEDRYEGWPRTHWYRELGKAAAPVLAARPAEAHPLTLGVAALREHFAAHPTTLICPGDLWTLDIPERALDLDFRLISSYYLAIRDAGRFYWSQHVCAPYLNRPDAAWFDSGLPVVGYFHDQELAVEGTGWMVGWLDAWQEAGARRFVDFRELSAALGRHLALHEQDGALRLTVTDDRGAPALVRPLMIGMRNGGAPLPARVTAYVDGEQLPLSVESQPDGSGRVVLPVANPPAR